MRGPPISISQARSFSLIASMNNMNMLSSIVGDIAEVCDEILSDDLREIKDKFIEMIQ